VLVAFYVFRVVKLLTFTFVTAMRIGMTDSGSTFGWIVEHRLSRFAIGTGYDKVPIEGLTALQLHGGKLARIARREKGGQVTDL
jgi:hypothetical protein